MSDYEDEEEFVDYSQLLSKSKNKKDQTLKRGNKANGDIEQDRLVKARQSLFECISQTRKIPKNTSVGYLEDDFSTSISQNKGNHLHTMGYAKKGVITLHPEEAAFLVARNALVVKDKNENSLEFEDFCEIICNERDGWISYDKYQVYAYLKRLGFIVLRSKNDPTFTHQAHVNSNESTTLLDHIINCVHGRYTQRPLVWDYLCKDFPSMYSTLHIIPSSPWYRPFYKSLCRTFDWDVYKPRPSWKKKDPGIPDFQIVVNNIHEPMPSLYQQNQLMSQLESKSNAAYGNNIKYTRLGEFSPTFLMALVGDAESVCFLKITGDGLTDISNESIKIQKRFKRINE